MMEEEEGEEGRTNDISTRFNSSPYTIRGVSMVRMSNMNPDEERVEE